MVGHALKRVHPASSRGCGPTRSRTVVFVVLTLLNNLIMQDFSKLQIKVLSLKL